MMEDFEIEKLHLDKVRFQNLIKLKEEMVHDVGMRVASDVLNGEIVCQVSYELAALQGKHEVSVEIPKTWVDHLYLTLIEHDRVPDRVKEWLRRRAKTKTVRWDVLALLPKPERKVSEALARDWNLGPVIFRPNIPWRTELP